MIACQDLRGRVTVSASALNAFPNKELLGSTFLHEAAVRTMLKVFGDNVEKYNRSEVELIRYAMPYILLNSDYDAKTLYTYAVDLGFAEANLAENGSSKYLIETDSKAKEAYLSYMAWLTERNASKKVIYDKIAELKTKSEKAAEEFWPMDQSIRACDTNLRQFSSEESFMDYFKEYLVAFKRATDAAIVYHGQIRSAAASYELDYSERSGYMAMVIGSTPGPSGSPRYLETFNSALYQMMNGLKFGDVCSDKIKAAAAK